MRLLRSALRQYDKAMAALDFEQSQRFIDSIMDRWIK
ncbi:hypothetical protein GGI1_10886 [Acidithiobacillus sp. GGI-221]|nr:hypothetical protein GGI1_10886 [Acidithiobacillus sp. GGI-221]